MPKYRHHRPARPWHHTTHEQAALRRAQRATFLRKLLSDPEDPHRKAHAEELQRILKFERRREREASGYSPPASSPARAVGRLRNIVALRRLTEMPNNPRRGKHAYELRRAEAAQARWERNLGRSTMAQVRHSPMRETNGSPCATPPMTSSPAQVRKATSLSDLETTGWCTPSTSRGTFSPPLPPSASGPHTFLPYP
jgi:hypothetical protein